MPSLAGRLRRLEAFTGARLTPCPECGRLPNGCLLGSPHRLVATFDVPETTQCPKCGAQTVYVLTLESPEDVP